MVALLSNQMDPFSDPSCLPSYYCSEPTQLFDIEPSEISFEAWGVPQKRNFETTDEDEVEISTLPPPTHKKKRVKVPEVGIMDSHVINRDEPFEMWCVEDLRNPVASGASTETKWKSWEEAQKHFSTLSPDASETSDVPEDIESKRAIVAAIKKAMWTTAYALDGKDVINCHLKNRNDGIFEFYAWKLLELLIQRHKFGQLELSEPVDKAGKEGGPKSFNDRLHDALHVLTAHKSIVKRIIARPASRIFVDDPMNEGTKVLANRRLNEKRGHQIARGKKARYSV